MIITVYTYPTALEDKWKSFRNGEPTTFQTTEETSDVAVQINLLECREVTHHFTGFTHKLTVRKAV